MSKTSKNSEHKGEHSFLEVFARLAKKHLVELGIAFSLILVVVVLIIVSQMFGKDSTPDVAPINYESLDANDVKFGELELFNTQYLDELDDDHKIKNNTVKTSDKLMGYFTYSVGTHAKSSARWKLINADTSRSVSEGQFSMANDGRSMINLKNVQLTPGRYRFIIVSSTTSDDKPLAEQFLTVVE
ncbi:MAG: hypothetical protein LBQ41_04525 [Candidatus Ancillula sp.]|nr:hypothetical protein [Candidatus Ancillula sp.]